MTLVGGCRCAPCWCNLDLNIELVIVTLTFKTLFWQYLRNYKCMNLIVGVLVGGWGGWVGGGGIDVEYQGVTLVLPLTVTECFLQPI